MIGMYIVCPTSNYAQQSIKPNEFKVGIFGATSCKTHFVRGCEVPFETPLYNGYKTSVLNILSEDGFNIYQTYAPNEWISEFFLKNYLKLSQANNFKVELSAGHYYKPTIDINGNDLECGTNVYDNCGNSIEVCQFPYELNYFRPNINNFINNIYKVSPYKDIIWGYHICEEASYKHFQHFKNDCTGNVWKDSIAFIETEIPPTNVNDAISYFKESLSSAGIINHKMVVMEANHHKNINANTNDQEGKFNPQEYILLLKKNDSRDVFFEGSYTQFPKNWQAQKYSDMFNDQYHYLGAFKSIDYAKCYSSEVHKVINIEGTENDSAYLAHYHSNNNIPNANWLWFQAYTSIIHGAKGIWFWDINFSWNKDEKDKKFWEDDSKPDRYNRNYFPENYQKYITYLAQEPRFLCDKNIISTDESTIIATKTDSTDLNCIVPDIQSYNIDSCLIKEKLTEKYGLRYTIRSNGTETFMIITNPLNAAILSVTLNFLNSSNQQIQNSDGVYVLFDNNQDSVNSSHYKVDRNSNINLKDGTIEKKYYIPFTQNKQLTISFGPMDVKVLKFVSNQRIPNYNKGWDIAWSNFGSGNISGHYVTDNDLFYIGDFDGDGTEEILCVGYTGGQNDWITVLKYINDDWKWYWSNYGSSSAGNGLYAYRYNFIVGDYDGDGKDELLGNDINGWTTLFKFDNGNWQWVWSDNGNLSHPIRPYKDKLYSGDFDGDGKVEMLGFNGWATLFHFDNGNWQWGWSTYGASNFNGWTYPPLSTDRILSGNLDSDSQDELFFLQTHSKAAWATIMDLKSNQSGWNWNWSANPQYSFPFIADWSLAGNGGSHTKYYLIKVNSNEPKYLLAMRKFCRNYLINMYKASNPNNIKAKANAIEKNFIASECDNDISVFPNPTDGKIQVLSTKPKITHINIKDMKGYSIYNAQYESLQKVEIDLSKYPTGIYILTITDSQNSVLFRKIILYK